jgi:nucleotide-binding universal stress UspA family protein
MVRTLRQAQVERRVVMFTRILVATDFSEPSDAALQYARTVATKFGGTLHLLHVIEDPYRAAYASEAYIPELAGLRDDLIADAEARMKASLNLSDFSGLGATVDALIGTPAWSIVEYASGHDIDLIVMGTHGRGGMSHLLMGSVAEKVVRTASCPVLTTRSLLAAQPELLDAVPDLVPIDTK